MLKTLSAQIKQYKKSTILTPIFAALEVVMEVLIPMAMARLVKYGIEGGDTGAIYRYGFLMMAMAMLSLVFGSVCAHTASHASTGFAANLRDGMYRNIQRFSFANIDKYSTAGLVTRMTTDVTNVQNAFQMITRIAVRSPLTLIFSMIAAFLINPELAGVFLIPLVLLGVVLGLIIKRATHLFDQVFKKYDDLNASVQENVSGIRVVKAFVREDFEDKKFGKAATNVYNLFVKAERIIAFNSPVMMLTIYGSVMALSWLGASLVTGGSLDVGDLTAMFTYVMNMLMNLMMLSMIFVMLTMSAASARRIVEVLNEEPSLSNPEQPLETVKDGSIDFNHVMFKYHADGNGDPILNDVDLHIKSGETVGIIGGTGCGKSTLVSLISRLYDATEGSVEVGGVDVRKYDMEALRNQVAVVLQKNVLFSGTIKENLKWGNADATDAEIEEACRAAAADGFIKGFPDGYDTELGQGGVNVSGGQKQRLCIARALISKPKIIILDDSTSAVDTATDAAIRKALSEELSSTTTIIIAQRIASVMDADRIVIMNEGKIDDVGTHAELMQRSEIYREVYYSQQKGVEE